jgi:hypothetical protein
MNLANDDFHRSVGQTCRNTIASEWVQARQTRPHLKDLTGLIYGGASFLQGVFPSKIHSRELFVPVMKRFGSFGVLYQCVIALPIPVRLLMHFHFDLYALVDGLDHGTLLGRILWRFAVVGNIIRNRE